MQDESGTTSLRSLQMAQLEILHEFARVCERLHLRYLIFSGTLLGAVRHKGFIPWDDDIDVIMFRNDFDIFCREAHKELKGEYFLQSMETEKEFPNVHAKLRDSTTTFIEECNAHRRMNHGIAIDVFPMDGVPNNPFIRKVGWALISVIGRLALLKLTCTGDFTLRMKIFKGISHLIPLSGRSMSLIYSRLCSLVDIEKVDNVAFSTWPSDRLARIVYPKEWFFDPVLLEFEGEMLPAPREHHKILVQLYRDYMRLPPEGERSGHLITKVSLTVPFDRFHERSKTE